MMRSLQLFSLAKAHPPGRGGGLEREPRTDPSPGKEVSINIPGFGVHGAGRRANTWWCWESRVWRGRGALCPSATPVPCASSVWLAVSTLERILV